MWNERWQPGGYYGSPPMSWVAAAVIGSAAVGGAVSAYSANKASDAQASAADKAAAVSMEQYYRTRADLAPYRDMGQSAMTELGGRLEHLTSPIVMDQEELEKTPGYQFALKQGLKAQQNSATARGLGISGAALKGAAAFATGLADQTYKTQFDIENINRTNAYNRLKALVDTGVAAAGATGTLGQKAADTAAQGEMAKGNAQAAGYNAIGSAGTKFADSVGGYAAYKGLYGGGPNSVPGESGGVGAS